MTHIKYNIICMSCVHRLWMDKHYSVKYMYSTELVHQSRSLHLWFTSSSLMVYSQFTSSPSFTLSSLPVHRFLLPVHSQFTPGLLQVYCLSLPVHSWFTPGSPSFTPGSLPVHPWFTVFHSWFTVFHSWFTPGSPLVHRLSLPVHPGSPSFTPGSPSFTPSPLVSLTI
jgi:hypothetical protein